MIDTHLHLDDPRFDPDRDAVVERAVRAGVRILITTGVDLESSRRAVALAERYPVVYAAVGIHPNHAHRASPGDFGAIAELAAHPRVIAIGECGLDFYRDWCPREVQQENLRRHVRLANALRKPLVIHNREAHADVLRILEEEDAFQVVMHMFTGPSEHAQECARRGYWMGVGGVITYPNAHEVREAVRHIPDERLLVETDAPYLAPHPDRTKRNEPAYLPRIVEALAHLRAQGTEAVAALVDHNARVCFGL
ncbi:MAG: TatD family hydrolase [Armatimonadota bacterium]|nr:TatD family hydrolase [Armatimonadota bacterium]MDR7562542.1 TatD family hydrolase [Armatimonadota bacterium]MDR7566876.1 TatD family hydrolase [Armatimonadota bacterium]MDR7602707.1 TatD family hydrolase [Armatimonadota bacterium]